MSILGLAVVCVSSLGTLLGPLTPTAGGLASSHASENAPPADEGFGRTIVSVGDLDGDGSVDFAIGAPLARDAGGKPCGKVYLVSGSDFRLLKAIIGPEFGQDFGCEVAPLGAIRGVAGSAILVSSAFGAGAKSNSYVVSCASGRILRTHTAEASDYFFGRPVANAGDIDADGADDYGLAFVGRDGFGVRIFSRANGSLLLQCGATDKAVFSIGALRGGHDWDGDQVPDVVVGARARVTRSLHEGILYFFSGRTGQLVDTVSLEGRRAFGKSIAVIQDANHDGVADLVVGSPEDTWSDHLLGGEMVLLSGKTHEILWMVRSMDSSFGSSVGSVSDLDGDDYQDIVVSAPEGCGNALPDGCAGLVYAFSTKSRSELFRLEGSDWYENFGTSIGTAVLDERAIKRTGGRGACTVTGGDRLLWVSNRPIFLFDRFGGSINPRVVRVYRLPARERVAELSAATLGR